MVFGIGGTPVRVRWYKADPAAAWAPEGNQFVSGNWVGRDLVAGELGEQPGAKPWRNGAAPRVYPVPTTDACLIDDALVNGLTTGEETGPWGSNGDLLCCSAAPFDCLDLPSTLNVSITDLSGCGSLVGSFTITEVADCVWQGGTPLFTLGYAFGAWFRSLACGGGDPTWTQVAFSWAPLNLVFDVLDQDGGANPTLCCSGTGTATFRVTVTE